MTGSENGIAAHYSSGTLLNRIADGLSALDKSLETAGPEDLKSVDEFHIGGLAATEALLEQIDIGPDTKVLDIGSGIGGTARFIVSRYGAKVHGVDLTPEYVETARALCNYVDVKAEFQQGSALKLPFDDAVFDIATLMHVGMNIENKEGLFAEAARVLKPGGVFAIFDVMSVSDGEIGFPVPWATAPEMSFVASPERYKSAARAVGFTVIAERDRGDFARQFFAKLAARIAEHGPPPVGLPVIMGDRAPEKIANMVAGLKSRTIAPVEMICRLSLQ